MKVHLRQRKQTGNGKISLYLEIYKGTARSKETGKIIGLREYEYLDLYLIKARTPFDRQHNKDTLKLAENIKAKRELEIKNGEYGFTSNFKKKTNFIEYFREQTEKHLQNKGTYDLWDSVLKHLIRFAGTQVTFRDIDKNFCERFKDYLITEAKTRGNKKLVSNTVTAYFQKFKTSLNKAVEDEIILKSPAKYIPTLKKIESKKEYLTIDELRKIARIDCRNDILKRAFLFSCLTGMRWGDIRFLMWGEVEQYIYKDKRGKEKKGWRIVFHQRKTKGLQYLDFSNEAREYLGTPGKPDETIFSGISYNSYMLLVLKEWTLRAGITKHITFHSGRHTHATLLLTNGVDIYTVSKRLGHTNIATTQIYAKIIPEKMIEAVNKIPDINI